MTTTSLLNRNPSEPAISVNEKRLMTFIGGELIPELAKSWVASAAMLKSNLQTMIQGYSDHLRRFSPNDVRAAVSFLKCAENRQKGANPVFAPDPLEISAVCLRNKKTETLRVPQTCSIRAIEMIATVNLLKSKRDPNDMTELANEIAAISQEKISKGFQITGHI